MAWFAALSTVGKVAVGASALTTAAGIKQADRIGKTNQSISNRNALIAEQEGNQILNQLDFNLNKFEKDFTKLQGETEVNLNKAGVDSASGTGLRIKIANATEAELQRKILTYNAEIGKAQKFEEAAFARISGNVARQQAKYEQIKLASGLTGSLLTMA
jgi:hypothetical protein